MVSVKRKKMLLKKIPQIKAGYGTRPPKEWFDSMMRIVRGTRKYAARSPTAHARITAGIWHSYSPQVQEGIVRRIAGGRGGIPRARPTYDDNPRKSKWYLDGYEQGEFAAQVNIGDDPDGMRTAMEEDSLGEIVGEIREHQTQMAGDISYDVGRSGGPSESQYEKWEEGFTEGFADAVKTHFHRPVKKNPGIVEELGKVGRAVYKKTGIPMGLTDVPDAISRKKGAKKNPSKIPFKQLIKFPMGNVEYWYHQGTISQEDYDKYMHYWRMSRETWQSPPGTPGAKKAVRWAERHRKKGQGMIEPYSVPVAIPNPAGKCYYCKTVYDYPTGTQKDYHGRSICLECSETCDMCGVLFPQSDKRCPACGAKPTYQANPAGPPDEHMARELALYAANDYNIYKQWLQPYALNMARKTVQGKFDRQKAIMGMANNAKFIQDKYWKEFSPGEIPPVMNAATKQLFGEEMFGEIQSDIEYKVNEIREGRLTVMGKPATPKPAPGRGYPTNPEELEELRCSFDGGKLGYMESVRYGDKVERFRTCMKCGHQWNERYWESLRGLMTQPQKNPKKSLQYYAITYGGVPMTARGRERFIKVASMNGYSKAEIEAYLKTEKNPKGRHPTIKKPGDPTYSKEWSGVSYAPKARGVVCPRCGGHLHKEGGSHYCPRCDDYVSPAETNPIPVIAVAAGAHVAGKAAEYVKKKRTEKAAKTAVVLTASNPKTRTGLYHPKKGTKEAKDFMARLRAMRKKK